MDWNKILNWTLMAGSHEFPGPDGGTCVNEAAIVAAGFEYKAINSAKDCPPCFSRPIAEYAIMLNDLMDNETRNRLLLPFVTRLAGTADDPEVEARRDRFICSEVHRRIYNDDYLPPPTPTIAARTIGHAALTTRYGASVWNTAVEILDAAIRLGKHEELPVETAVERMASFKAALKPVEA